MLEKRRSSEQDYQMSWSFKKEASLILKIERVGELTSVADNLFHNEIEDTVKKLRRKLVRANLVRIA